MLPITELRATIPYGILQYNIEWGLVFAICVLGNFLVCIPLIYFLTYFDQISKKSSLVDNILDKIYTRTRSRSNIVNKYNYWGIIVFVGIPLPLTGAWTGCLASHLLGLDKKKTLISIFIGLTISATIVSLLSLIAVHLLPYIGVEIR